MPGTDTEPGRAHDERLERHETQPLTDLVELGLASMITGNDTRCRSDGTLRGVLLVTDERFIDHDPGAFHPERPDRLRAVLEGVSVAGVDGAVTALSPRRVTRSELARVHDEDLIDLLEGIEEAGGGRVDADTRMSPGSLEAARFAAGSVLTAVEAMEADDESAAYCVVRPPGHHATSHQSMGFCLFNSVAVAAARLSDAGERIAIIDIDAHHGNGTQEIFYEEPTVLFASIHQSPLYPGTGAVAERGRGAGAGTTLNVPVPAGATGDVALMALDEVIIPAVERFAPDWIIVSAGYDGHRADPITDLGYTAADYADMVARIIGLGNKGRAIVVLEGGYDLDALVDCSGAVAATLVGESHRPEPASSGGPGTEAVAAAARILGEPASAG